MTPNTCINEIERIVLDGPAYVGPHGDPLAHVYGMASMLRDLGPTDDQRQKIATAIAEFKIWFKRVRGAGFEGVERERVDVMVAIANLKRAYRAASASVQPVQGQ